MAKLMHILVFACVAVALCAAEAPLRTRSARLQQQQRRNRFLARQQVADEAVTPYPSAKELKPEIPFNEVENALPVESTAATAGSGVLSLPRDADDTAEAHIPDEIYGPPEDEEQDDAAVADEVPIEAPAAEADAPEDLPVEDEQQIAEDIAAAEEEAAAAAAAADVAQSSRLVFGRRIGARRSARPAKLRQAVKRSARLQQLKQQQLLQPQQLAQQQLFYYPAQFQAW